jgi:hypothetical protein
MALGGNTITISVNAVNKVLNRINQDNYATRYYLHEATQDFTVNVRHSTEKRGGVVYDVHTMNIIQLVFATGTVPARTRESWITIRNEKSDDFTAVGYIPTALADLTKVSGHVDQLLGWVQ